MSGEYSTVFRAYTRSVYSWLAGVYLSHEIRAVMLRVRDGSVAAANLPSCIDKCILNEVSVTHTLPSVLLPPYSLPAAAQSHHAFFSEKWQREKNLSIYLG